MLAIPGDYQGKAGPRDAPVKPLGPLAGRLDRAFKNLMETFPLFAAAVLLAHFGLSVDDVLAEFRRREGVSGIDEKKARTQG